MAREFVTLHGKYVQPGDSGVDEPAGGSITFLLSGTMKFPDENVVVVPTPEVVDLDANGEFELRLVATDSANADGGPFTYLVTHDITGLVLDPYSIELTAAPSVQYLADLTEVATGDPVLTYVTQTVFNTHVAEWQDDLRFSTVEANVFTASRDLALADAGTVVEMDVASGNTLTVPPNSTAAFPVDTVIEVYQAGAGQTTVVAGAGVTIRARSGLLLAGQYATASLRQRVADEWVLTGELTT